MKSPLSRLVANQSGIAHWALPVLLVVVLGVGAVGYKVHNASHAQTVPSMAGTCTIVGPSQVAVSKAGSTTYSVKIVNGGTVPLPSAMKISLGPKGLLGEYNPIKWSPSPQTVAVNSSHTYADAVGGFGGKKAGNSIGIAIDSVRNKPNGDSVFWCHKDVTFVKG